MLGLGFAIGIIEDKIENIIASTKLDSKSKKIIVDELNDMKSKFHNKQDIKHYTIKLKFGPTDKDWATYKNVTKVQITKAGYLWIKTEVKLVSYRWNDIMYFEQEVQNE